MPGSELEAGRVFVDLIPRLQKGFGASVEKELDGPLGRIKSKGAAIGKVLAVGLTAGVVGGGALLLGAANTLDASFDKIQTSTGATGEKLEGLKQSFRNVGRDAPQNLEAVASALADVSKRTDLTGKPLEDLTGKFLALSRLTDEEVGPLIASSSRLFGDWGVAVGDQGPKLDELYRAAQLTGVGVGDLADQMVKYGAPLRQLGFSFDESAALIGKFEKEGVNTGLVMGSLRVALGKMAKAGEAPVETLARVQKEIKEAGSAGEANALALEVFGARAGPDMAAAIREGRFEIGDLVKDLKSGKTSIEDTAAQTDDFSEKFAKLKNRAILAAEPLAGKLFDAINAIADAAGPVVGWIGDRMPEAFDRIREVAAPVISDVVDAFRRARPVIELIVKWLADKLPAAFESTRKALAPVVSAIRDFVKANPKPVLAGLAAVVVAVLVPAFVAWAVSAGAAAISTLAAIAPILLVIAAVGLLVGGLVYAYQNFEGFRNIVDSVVKFLTDVVVPKVKQFASYVAAEFALLVQWVRDHWSQIQEAISHVVNVIVAIVSGALDLIVGFWHQWGDEILAVLRAAWDLIASVVKNAIDFVAAIIRTVIAVINGDWGKAWDGIKDALAAVWDSIYAIAKFGITVVKNVISGVLDTLSVLWGKVWGGMKAVMGGIWDGLTSAATGALNLLLGVLESGVNAAIDLLNHALDAIDTAAGPLVNFGEIPHVSFPRLGGNGGGAQKTVAQHSPPKLADGGTATRPGAAIVGDGGNGSGTELAILPKGASVIPLDVARMISAAALEGSGAGQGNGVVFEKGAVAVDARGIQTPEQVGDTAARVIGWRTAQRTKR